MGSLIGLIWEPSYPSLGQDQLYPNRTDQDPHGRVTPLAEEMPTDRGGLAVRHEDELEARAAPASTGASRRMFLPCSDSPGCAPWAPLKGVLS